jgi:P4 family phage/plasmid primase-like protien
MDDIFSKNIQPLFWEIIGASISYRSSIEGKQSLKNIFFLLGEGNTGKSVLLRVIQSFLGNNGYSNETIESLINNRFTKKNLVGKLMNIASDITDVGGKKLAELKALTGNDTIVSDVKFKDTINFISYATLLFSCNKLPLADEADQAYFNRCVILQTNKALPDSERDTNLLQRLLSDECMSYILNKAVDGYQRFKKNGYKLSSIRSVKENREKYMMESNPKLYFLKSYLEFDENDDYQLTFRELDDMATAYQRNFRKPYPRNVLIGDIIREDYRVQYDVMGERLLNVRLTDQAVSLITRMIMRKEIV